MSIRNLSHFFGNEDFADSHEPLFDGTGEPPNVNTQASEIKAHDSGSETNDTTDTPDQKADEAEKEAPAQADEQPGVPAATDSSKEETPGESESTDEEPLEHDSVAEVESDEKGTEKDTTSLESFLPNLKRAQLIGFTKKQTAELSGAIGRLRKKAGLKGAVTISTESINEAIDLGRKRQAKLAKDKVRLKSKVSQEAYDDIDLLQASGVSGADIQRFQQSQVAAVNPAPVDANQEPLAHGVEPLDPAEAADITQTELVADQMADDSVMRGQMAALEHLMKCQKSVEGYIGLIREAGSKGISKQAAAILNTGLEHIDRSCNLRVRTTGLEAFDASPRFAMESAEVDQKGLLQRARELGAKIVTKIIEFLESLSGRANQLFAGITSMNSAIEKIDSAVNGLKGEPKVDKFKVPGNRFLWAGDDFAGDYVTQNEASVYHGIDINIEYLLNQVIKPILQTIKSGGATAETADKVKQIIETKGKPVADAETFLIPGNYSVSFKKWTVAVEGDSEAAEPASEEIEIPALGQLRRQWVGIKTQAKNLSDLKIWRDLDFIQSTVPKALLAMRKDKGEQFDENAFQEIQKSVMQLVVDSMNDRTYYSLLRYMAAGMKAKVVYFTQVIKAYQPEPAAKAE